MNVLSFFDGMSCGQLALQRNGVNINNYYACEIDKYAMQVTQKNFPNTKQLGDVTKINGTDFDKIDLFTGGSPCQGFSFAGKQLNFDDPRSKLFFEYVRVLKELRVRNPDVLFLLENVKMKKEFQDIITQHLGVEPVEINSNLVSAQNRKRLYWTNIEGITQPKDKGILLKDILENFTFDREPYYIVFNSNRPKNYKSDKSMCLVTSGGSKTKGVGICDDSGMWRKLTPIECERLQTLPDNYTEGVSNSQRYKMLGNGWTVDVITHIFKNIK